MAPTDVTYERTQSNRATTSARIGPLAVRLSNRVLHAYRQHTRAALVGVAVLCVAGVGLSCISQRNIVAPWKTPAVEMVWPQPPERSRIQFAGSIHSAEDLGRRSGLGRALSGLFFGNEDTELVRPTATARNKAGLLVIADPGVPTVHLFDLERGEYRRPKFKDQTLLQSPVGVAATDDGIVYVTDSAAGQVFAFDAHGALVARLGDGLFSRPTGIALNAAQDAIYVVDTSANHVVVLNRKGEKIGVFGERGLLPGQFNSPTYIASTPKGYLNISDSLNFRIQTVQADGTPVSTFGEIGDGAGAFTRPKGVASDPLGNLFVVDGAFDNVQIFDSEGALLLAFGEAGIGPGEFCLPVGICIDSDNLIWVADSYNRRVLVFRQMEAAGA